MGTEPQNERPFQFSLRSLLLFALAFALVMQYRWPLMELVSTWTGYVVAEFIVPPIVIVVGFWGGRLLDCIFARGRARRVVIAVSWAFLVLVSISVCYLLWARHRWLGWPPLSYNTAQPWPFPDLHLFAYHDWLDAQRPAPPGTIKIHGEYYTVLLTLDLVIVASFGMVGTLLGIVAPGSPRWLGRKLVGGFDKIRTTYAVLIARSKGK